MLSPQMIVLSEEGENIALEYNPGARKVPPREQMPVIPIHPGRTEENPGPEEARIAKAVRSASRDVYSGWTEPKGDSDPGDTAERAIEA